MGCITLPIDESLKKRLERFPWVNWSEAGREEIIKREIFDRYVKTRKLTTEDNEYCERMDWHPVDELPLKESFAKTLSETVKGPHKKTSLKELDDLMGLK